MLYSTVHASAAADTPDSPCGSVRGNKAGKELLKSPSAKGEAAGSEAKCMPRWSRTMESGASVELLS